MTEEQNVHEKVDQLKREIAALSSELKNLGQEKEDKYTQKEQINQQLNILIQEVNKLKDQKAETDAKIKTQKELRDKLNLEVKELANKIKTTREVKPKKEREHIPTKYMKDQIRDLQQRIETEAMPFEKEQKIMKQIKEIELKIKENESEDNQFNNYKDLRRAINQKKTDADRVHKAIQGLASQSTEIFKQLTDKSKQIAKIKGEKLECQGILYRIKNEISKANAKLGDILKKWSEHRKDLSEAFAAHGLGLLKEKTKVAKEKLAGKKKLTTDDILALQREGMDK